MTFGFGALCILVISMSLIQREGYVSQSSMTLYFSFSHAGASAWNDLPEDLRAVADSAKFRQQLKTYFFTRAFNVQ